LYESLDRILEKSIVKSNSCAIITRIGDIFGLADENARAGTNQLTQLFDLFVGERNASLGPVEAVMNVRITFAYAVDPDIPTKRCVLRRCAQACAVHVRLMGDGIDHSLLAGVIDMSGRGIVQAQKNMKTTFAIDVQNLELTQGCGGIAFKVQR